MSYRYDFDMFSVVPDAVQHEFADALGELGVADQPKQQVALFRDPKLVDALRSADEPIRQLFLESGFGFNVYDSGAPEGLYPAKDEEARTACLLKLSQNIKSLPDLRSRDWGGFDLRAFLGYVKSARPMDEEGIEAAAEFGDRHLRRKRLLSIGLLAGAVMAAGSALGTFL